MKLPYKNELYELRKWIDFTNANLQMQFLHTPQEIQRVHQWISTRYLSFGFTILSFTKPSIASNGVVLGFVLSSIPQLRGSRGYSGA